MRWMVTEPQLPWDDNAEDEKNYWLILSGLLVASLLFSWLVFNAVLEEKKPQPKEDIPERFVKLVLEQKKKIVTPPPKQAEVEPKKKELDKKEKPLEKIPELKEKPKQKPKQKKVVKQKPEGNRKDAREKARKNLAVFDVLADVRDASASRKIANQNDISADVGKAKTIERDLLVNNAKKSSGGVKIAKASTNIGGSGLTGGGSRQVSSNLAAAKIKQSRSAAGGGKAQRPSENIEKFMDYNKSSFFSLYNRALRKNPSMQGEVIFRMTILSDGRVSKVTILSSELNDPILERKLLTKIRAIRFTSMNVTTWQDNYRITFLPS